MNDVAPAIGHNRPPEPVPEPAPQLEGVTAEILAEELTRDRVEFEQLIERAKTAKIETLEDASGVHLLAAKMKDLGERLEVRRKARKDPYLRAGQLVDDNFNELIKPLASYYAALRTTLTVFEQKRKEEAAALRRRAEEEARRREEEAAALRRQVEEEEAAGGQLSMTDRLDVIQREEAAELARQQAETIRPEPIPALVGGVGTRREIHFSIDNLGDAVGWLLMIAPEAVEEAISPLIMRRLRDIGPDKVATARHPGITAWVAAVATIRRRR